ncbi:uncharacterized protein G2W53_015835 [Senna tora]|uniref:Uncharacterized protein n=1 Tax=Senna tora TaxID=362788 RepID=A0A834WWH7_9FABA|nr:uncharacterized protein G2W53_015835 [Senna tora]
MARLLLRIAVVPKRTYPSRDGRKSQRWCYQMYRRRARKESMMLLLKVSVTSMKGVDDGTSYAVQDEQEVEAGMRVIDDDTTKGSSYMRGRSQRWHYRKSRHFVEESSFFLPLTSLLAQCKQRKQGRARGCVEWFDDGATEDSDNHVKLLPCSDIPPCDDKEMLKVILSVDFSLKTKQDGILCALKDALTECGSDGYDAS